MREGYHSGVAQMADIPDAVRESVRQFLNVLGKQRKVQAAYLYGSQVKGIATEWSDIDLAVISSDFSSDLFEERLTLLRLAAQVDDRIEPRPFTPEDFNDNDPLASEIRRTGLRVA
jgi:predicted nucleotidyltransferase